MSVVETKREAMTEGEPKVRLLTYVLSYEDLCAAQTTTHHLSDAASELRIGRASDAASSGWSSSSELRILDPWLSGRHAALLRRGDGDVLRDLGSANGTFVNGVRITEQRLGDGDLIEVGHSLLCYRVVDAALARALAGLDPALRFGPARTHCPEVAMLLTNLGRVAPSRESVLILGETGAGKEYAAEAIHRLSRRQGSFWSVDCGAVPESLFESTFFGHRRGAFTGAAESQPGEILRAQGGTLFLDEVANMSLASQAKLLRVIETGQVTAVGAAEARQVNVRWVAATNRDLLADGSGFRPDLLRRLASFVLRLPPLRRRREDLGALTAHLLSEAGVVRASITAAAGRRLFSDAFAGNVRQLRSALRSAALLAGEGPIDVSHLPEPAAAPALPHLPVPASSPAAGLVPPEAPPSAVEDAVGKGRARRPSREALDSALRVAAGNVVHAAQAFDTTPRQLYRWMEHFGIELDDYRR